RESRPVGSVCSSSRLFGARGAMAFDEHFGDVADARSGHAARRGETHLRQTADVTAIETQKMRVLITAGLALANRFESPDVVAQFPASNEAGFGEIDQVAVDGRLVEAAVLQRG